MRTLEELRKEINGKQVVYVDDSDFNGFRCDAIILAPPGEEKVVIKPYGVTPEEVFKKFTDAGSRYTTLKTVSAIVFCFVSHAAKERREVFEKIASIPDGGEYNFEVVMGSRAVNFINPSCPYG